MLIPALALLVGCVALWLGGEQFVIGTSRLAERTRLPLVLVGMVVAGFGTSTPELTVSVLASTRGEGELALGNALGSNVANVLLVLPLASLAAAWAVRGELVRREVFAVQAATGIVVAASLDGSVSRPEAVLLLAAFAVTMAWVVLAGLRAPERRRIEAEVEDLVGPRRRLDVPREAGRTLLGLGVVIASADRVVWGASRVAMELGISEAAVGLTIVAVGTSLPEVVTGIVAARRGEPDIVLGNVLGSNVFNALLIVGVAGLVEPLPLSGTSRLIAISGAAVTSLLLLAFLFPGYRVTRNQALVGLLAYAAFTAALYVLA